MNQIRGVLAIAIGGYAIYTGYMGHAVGTRALLTYGVGALLIALGIWRLVRGTPRPLV